MNISNIIIVPKVSKYELDMCSYMLTHDEVIAKYKKEGINAERMVKSHERQKKSLEELKKFFGEEQFVSRDELTKEIATNSDLVIALGGDNHFKYVSHFVEDSLIMGINSDPLSSEGVLTYFKTNNFEKVLKRITKEDFKVEEWNRLEARLNNTKTELATCEYFLGEAGRKDMSRHIIELNGKSEEQKGSGLLVVTGAGSTGWYDSACRYLHKNGNRFSKREIRFLVTEPYRGKLCGYSMLEGILEKELVVHSLNDTGRLINDSVEEYDFNRGTTVVIRIADKPLRVLQNI